MKTGILSCIARYPGLKRALQRLRNRFFPNSSVSRGYIALEKSDATVEGGRLRSAWQDTSIPKKQRGLVEKQLQEYKSGKPIEVFDVFIHALQALPHLAPNMSLLEVGCSSGFYSEIIKIAKLPLIYSGCDYSDTFIQMAQNKYPDLSFSVADATNLHYPKDSFDIVVSGCCLLHIPEYAVAIEEATRVAKDYVIFHRTPVVWGQQEQWYRKLAYGVETVEIHFNEQEFLTLLKNNGLELLATFSLHEDLLDSDGSKGRANRTYVCKKRAH